MGQKRGKFTSLFLSSAGTSISASQNNTLSGRSGTATFTQSESGKTTSVSLSQAAGVEGWNYTFGTPTPYKNIGLGGRYEVDINSYRIRTINGSEIGEKEKIAFNAEVTKNFNEREPITYIEVINNDTIYIECDTRELYTGETAEITAIQNVSGGTLKITLNIVI